MEEAPAESDEDGREAEHEGDRRADQGMARAPVLRLGALATEILDRDAGHVAQIGRHQRQHAGRQER